MRKKSSLCPASKEVYPALLREHFCYCFSKAAMRMRAMLDQELGAYGIVAIQFGILNMLIHSEPMSQIELGSALGIDKASIVKFIDDLEGQGMLARKAGLIDRRVKTLEVTKKGRVTCLKAMATTKLFQEKFLEPLTSKEQEVIRIAIPKLLGVKAR